MFLLRKFGLSTCVVKSRNFVSCDFSKCFNFALKQQLRHKLVNLTKSGLPVGGEFVAGTNVVESEEAWE